MAAFESRYDAVVVGARCAGAATAMLLARRGLSVLLFDRDRRGADTLSTLALMRAGVLQLHRWGLVDALLATGAEPIRSTSFIYDDEAITVPIKPRNGVDALYAPRRTVLDPLLADAAAAAGADVHYGPRLADLLHGPEGRVNGVVIEDRDRALHEIRAGIVIGADGLRSGVAQKVGAPVYRQGQYASGVVYAFWPALENAGNLWYYRRGCAAGAIPTHGGDTCVFVAVPSSRFHAEIHADLAAGYHRVLMECAPALARELAGATPSERHRGYPGHPGVMRQSHGAGWALVGDAGYFKDPITAHGITDALRDAEFLARAVTRGSESALAEYQSTRDALGSALFDITDAIAGYHLEMDAVKQLHLELSRTMNEEVDALLGLDAPSAPPAGETAEGRYAERGRKLT